MKFNLNDIVKYFSFTDEVYSLDIIDKLSQEYSAVNFGCDPLEFSLTNVKLQREECAGVDDMTNYLDSQMQYKKHKVNENSRIVKERPPSSNANQLRPSVSGKARNCKKESMVWREKLLELPTEVLKEELFLQANLI